MTLSMKLVCGITTLFGSYWFYTNHLGWLDGAKLASPNFFAITKDKEIVSDPIDLFWDLLLHDRPGRHVYPGQ